MKIEQFYDKALAHASYAILSEGEIALIDPARDPQIYYAFARANQASIIAVLETHPHADFVSSHLEIHHQTGASVYVNSLLGASYPHVSFDDGDRLKIGALELIALHTPGHSPDSNSYLLMDAQGKAHSLFSGDTLFVGDVGRPDLRENVGNVQAKSEALARELYRSTREKIMPLDPLVRVYPAHGAGSLCGKNISADLHSTIGREMQENYALQSMDEDTFVALITREQPWIPAYFAFDVALNRSGAAPLEASLQDIPCKPNQAALDPAVLCVDTRPAEAFRKSHIQGAINIPESNKFETWLGAVISPGEGFYLLGSSEEKVRELLQRVAKIGYENQVKGLLWADISGISSPEFNPEQFKQHPGDFNILDVRNEAEVKAGEIFPGALGIPLYALRNRLEEIPQDKPLVVHCAGGLRSGIAASMLSAHFTAMTVLDMGKHIQSYTNV